MSKNLATTTIASHPGPPTSATSVTVATGTGSRLFAGMAVIHPADAVPTAANAEVVSITDVTGDVVTIVRAQESSTARAIVTGDILTQGITAAMWDALVASNAGKAAASHVHSAADVTSGTLPLARGGTGGTDAATAQAALGLGTAATMTPATIAADPALTATYGPGGTAGNAPLASPAFTGSPTAPTPTAGDSSTRLATTAFVNTSLNVDLGNASGDATGATDYATIQAALTSARTAGGGKIVGKAGQVYLINNTLQIGTGAELDMTGCTVRLVTGTNKPMLTNYSSANPVATDLISTSAGNVILTHQVTSTLTAAAAGQTLAVQEITFTGNVGSSLLTYVGVVKSYNAGTRGITVDVAPPATSSGKVATLFSRDTGIRITGGTWDRQGNGVGDNINSHVMVLRSLDGVRVKGLTFLGSGSTGLYGLLVAGATSVVVEDITYGVNPNSGIWSGTPGYPRDGVHFVGPCSNIAVARMFGFPGDDMVAVTTSDWTGIAAEWCGDVTDMTFEDVYPTSAGACSVKLMAGPGTALRRARVRNLYGSVGGSGGAVWVGDDERQAKTAGGVVDDVLIEGVYTNTGGRQLITLLGRGLGRIKIRDVKYSNASGSDAGVIVVGRRGPTVTVPTVVASLEVSNAEFTTLGGSQVPIFVEPGSSVDRLVTEGWEPRASQVAGVVRSYIGARRTVGRMATVGNWYPATEVGGGASVNLTLVTDKLWLSLPRIAEQDMTIDQLAMYVNTIAAAGGVARMGVYRVNGFDPYAVTLTSPWATLLQSTTAFATDGTTGVQAVALTSPAVIPAGQAFSLGIVAQAQSVVARIVAAAPSSSTPWGMSSAWGGGSFQVVSATGVSAALPSTFTPSAFEPTNGFGDNGVMFRRSA